MYFVTVNWKENIKYSVSVITLYKFDITVGWLSTTYAFPHPTLFLQTGKAEGNKELAHFFFRRSTDRLGHIITIFDTLSPVSFLYYSYGLGCSKLYPY